MIAYKKLSDKEALSLLRNDDEAALTFIFKKYWSPLFVSAFNILKDAQVCEDIIQDIFIKLWDRRSTLEITVSLKAYLYASCKYELFRQIKLNNVREDIFDTVYERILSPSVYGNLEHKEMIAQINAIVDTLPEKCRLVYKLSREEELSHKEIAEKLGISTKTVENHITKALQHLRTSLGITITVELISFLLGK